MRVTLYYPKLVEPTIQSLLPLDYTVVQGVGHWHGWKEDVAIYIMSGNYLSVGVLLRPIVEAMLQAGERCVYYEVEEVEAHSIYPPGRAL